MKVGGVGSSSFWGAGEGFLPVNGEILRTVPLQLFLRRPLGPFLALPFALLPAPLALGLLLLAPLGALGFSVFMLGGRGSAKYPPP